MHTRTARRQCGGLCPFLSQVWWWRQSVHVGGGTALLNARRDRKHVSPRPLLIARAMVLRASPRYLPLTLSFFFFLVLLVWFCFRFTSLVFHPDNLRTFRPWISLRSLSPYGPSCDYTRVRAFDAEKAGQPNGVARRTKEGRTYIAIFDVRCTHQSALCCNRCYVFAVMGQPSRHQ